MTRYALSPAAGPQPCRNGTFRLDHWTATVDYAAVEDRRGLCRVVATIAPDPRAGEGAPAWLSRAAPIRFAVTLAPGQKHTVALARPGHSPAPSVLEITHAADALSVEVVQPAAR